MVAKMQAAEQPVSVDPEPTSLDQISSQAKHNYYKPGFQPVARQGSSYAAPIKGFTSVSGAEFSVQLMGNKGSGHPAVSPQVAASGSPAKSPANGPATSKDCYDSGQAASKVSSEKTLLAARTSSASEALSKLTSPLYWSDSYRSYSKPQASVSNGPRSGPQLYYQRIAALKSGRLYTRLPADSYRSQWANVKAHPDYNQWKNLLALEARAVSKGQGSNRLSIVLGDSISQWLPMQDLPNSQLWMNQGISGDTTRGILQRISAFKDTRPNSIYVMAGVNDLKNGATDWEVTSNLRKIMQQLRSHHPKAQIFVQSILPTDTPNIGNERIRSINAKLAAIAREEKVSYLNLHSQFVDFNGKLNANLTTDGIHLNPEGYSVWQSILRNMEYWVALNRNLGYQTPWSS